ncbi:MAG: restriction endonuclease [Candidatus Levybacteria bacterium]|nr:restriction endonuclease [Candidatus Levybacteria bacterium]MBI3070283.1 restriction endonuclease [Candidatus Levybacteria bacterium]
MITVVKASGEKEPFSEEKVRASIRRAAVAKELQEQVVEHVKSKLYENIKTSEIYRHIIEFLATSKTPFTRSKYSLKQAIMDLGPTGYPFEDFVAEILKAMGWVTTVRTILQGKCVTHEIDITAIKNSEKAVIEVKFHNLPGTKTGIHEALYTKARFNDVVEKNDFNQVWLVTNTKISLDAITYGVCMGMKVISWNYPEDGSLRDLIEQVRLHPITALTALSQSQKQKLLENHVVRCLDICQNPTVLDQLEINDEQKKAVLSEAQFVCNRV